MHIPVTSNNSQEESKNNVATPRSFAGSLGWFGTLWKTRKRFAIAAIISALLLIWSWWPQQHSAIAGTTGSGSPSFLTEILASGIGQIQRQIVGGESAALRGEDRGRVNVLLLGQGNQGHDGQYLTDTIMIASLDMKTKQAALFSIPRDLVVPMNGLGQRNWQKINAVNAFAQREADARLAKDPKALQGGQLTMQEISKIFGIPIDYYVRIDFDFFTQFIDDIGGIDVTVEKSFVDTSYPTENYGYQTIRFDAGRQHMNGDTALKYVRSRHGSNDENSDFARSKRQQIVMLAVMDKVKSFSTLASPSFIKNTLDNMSKNVQTDLTLPEIMRFTELGLGWSKSNIHTFNFSDTPGNMLTGSVGSDGASILLPDSGDFSYMHNFMTEYFSLQQTLAQVKNVLIVNATKQSGMASYYAQQLATFGFSVETGNAVTDIAPGVYANDDIAPWFTKWFGLTPSGTPGAPTRYSNSSFKDGYQPDVVLILGKDQAQAFQKILRNLQRYDYSRQLEAAHRAEEKKQAEAGSATIPTDTSTPAATTPAQPQ